MASRSDRSPNARVDRRPFPCPLDAEPAIRLGHTFHEPGGFDARPSPRPAPPSPRPDARSIRQRGDGRREVHQRAEQGLLEGVVRAGQGERLLPTRRADRQARRDDRAGLPEPRSQGKGREGDRQGVRGRCESLRRPADVRTTRWASGRRARRPEGARHGRGALRPEPRRRPPPRERRAELSVQDAQVDQQVQRHATQGIRALQEARHEERHDHRRLEPAGRMPRDRRRGSPTRRERSRRPATCSTRSPPASSRSTRSARTSRSARATPFRWIRRSRAAERRTPPRCTPASMPVSHARCAAS